MHILLLIPHTSTAYPPVAALVEGVVDECALKNCTEKAQVQFFVQESLVSARWYR